MLLDDSCMSLNENGVVLSVPRIVLRRHVPSGDAELSPLRLISTIKQLNKVF
jgi:hypothetical protein